MTKSDVIVAWPSRADQLTAKLAPLLSHLFPDPDATDSDSPRSERPGE